MWMGDSSPAGYDWQQGIWKHQVAFIKRQPESKEAMAAGKAIYRAMSLREIQTLSKLTKRRQNHSLLGPLLSLWKTAETAGQMLLLPQWGWQTQCVISAKLWASRKLKGWPWQWAPARASASPRLSIHGLLRLWHSQLLQHLVYKLCPWLRDNAVDPLSAPWCPLNLWFHFPLKGTWGEGEEGDSTQVREFAFKFLCQEKPKSQKERAQLLEDSKLLCLRTWLV